MLAGRRQSFATATAEPPETGNRGHACRRLEKCRRNRVCRVWHYQHGRRANTMLVNLLLRAPRGGHLRLTLRCCFIRPCWRPTSKGTCTSAPCAATQRPQCPQRPGQHARHSRQLSAPCASSQSLRPRWPPVLPQERSKGSMCIVQCPFSGGCWCRCRCSSSSRCLPGLPPVARALEHPGPA